MYDTDCEDVLEANSGKFDPVCSEGTFDPFSGAFVRILNLKFPKLEALSAPAGYNDSAEGL